MDQDRLLRPLLPGALPARPAALRGWRAVEDRAADAQQVAGGDGIGGGLCAGRAQEAGEGKGKGKALGKPIEGGENHS